MAFSTPVGTGFYISQTFASAKTATAVSNANPAVVTSVAHGYADDDELLFLSGWELANYGVYRGDQLTADTVALKGLNTTSTTRFAAGSGTGTLQKVSSWIEIPQILSVNPSGGGPRYIDVRTVKALQGIKIPDGFEASVISWDIATDINQTNWATLLDISRSGTLVAYKATKGTTGTYGYGYFSMAEQATQASGAVDKTPATFTAIGPLISY